MSAPLSHRPAFSFSGDEPYEGAAALAMRAVLCNFEWRTGRFEVQEIMGEEPEGMLAQFLVNDRRFAVVAFDRLPAMPDVPASRALGKVFTHREVQVVELVSNGLRNKQIATRLGLSEFTVAAYVKQICRKLDVNNRTAMVATCVQRFGVKPDVQPLGTPGES
jgi:DNA-binding CsgD family transcriptional regulator